MIIEGLITAHEIDGSDHIGAAVEALNVLGLIEDRDQVTESVTTAFSTLHQSGRSGEAFIQLPRSVITLANLVQASDSTNYTKGTRYAKSRIDDALWTPGFGHEGYKAEDLDNLTLRGTGDFAPHARLAVYNLAHHKEPLLHFLDKPFDKKMAEKDEETQQEAIKAAAAAYKAEGHEGFAMTPLNAKAVAFIGLTRRIKGAAMPIEWGTMIDATLPRKTLDGYSCVGSLDSFNGQLDLSTASGLAHWSLGVGLSVGRKTLKA